MKYFMFIILWAILLTTVQAKETTETLRLFIGTYTGENGDENSSQGIYTCRFNSENGTLSEPVLAAKCNNPAFLAVHPTQLRLYAISEQGKKGILYAFSYKKQTEDLTLIDEKDFSAQSACHLCLCSLPAPESDAVVIANYSSGNVVSFPISADGKIGNIATDVPHIGSGQNTARQKTAHPHGAYFNAAFRTDFNTAAQTVAVPDLGMDKVVFYNIDLKTAKLTENPDRPYLILPPGRGPRHLVVSTDGHFIYVTNELTSTVCVFEMKGKNPPMIQEVSTLPEGANKSKNSTAEIELSSSGKFLYVSNRGDDSIAIFSVDQANGKLELIQTVSSGGKHPRYFCLDPSGRFLLVCNMETNNIIVFTVDSQSGKLTPTETVIHVSKPVCAVFVP